MKKYIALLLIACLTIGVLSCSQGTLPQEYDQGQQEQGEQGQKDPPQQQEPQTAYADNLGELLDQEDQGFTPLSPEDYSKHKLELLFTELPADVDNRHVRGLMLDHFLENYPSYWEQGGSRGVLALKLSVALEESGAKSDVLEDLKFRLLLHGCFDEFHPQYLANTPVYRIADLALTWLTEHPTTPQMQQAVQTAVSAAAQQDQNTGNLLEQMTSSLQKLEKASDATFEEMGLYGPKLLVISSDGKQIAILVNEQDTSDKHWYDLEQGKVRASLRDSFQSTAAWSPDSKALAVFYDIPGYGERTLEVWAGDPAEQILSLTLPGSQFGLGWQDSSHLLVAEKSEDTYLVRAVNINSGAQSELASFPVQPKLTASGKAGAAWIEGDQLWVSINGSVTGYPLPFAGDGRIHSWLPGDSGLVWNREYHANDYSILDFATGAWSTVQIPGLWLYPGGWVDKTHVYGKVDIRNAGDIVLLDLDDLTVRYTGLTDPYWEPLAWPHIYRYTDSGLEIYKLD